MQGASERYETDVFINCPFDDAYDPLFDAILFAVTACGFRLRCSLEVMDGSEIRLVKLLRLIRESRLGIHDISRTELDDTSGLPRFNMPFELGMFLGAGHFGGGIQRRKTALILDSTPYRYQQFLSDIAGQDIVAHGNDATKVLVIVRDWLKTHAGTHRVPGSAQLSRDYASFLVDRPRICRELDLEPHRLKFQDRSEVVQVWIQLQQASRLS